MAAENRLGGVGVGEEGWKAGSRRPPARRVLQPQGSKPGGAGASAHGGGKKGGFQVLVGGLTGLADGLDVKGKAKRGSQDDSQVCGQATGQCGS